MPESVGYTLKRVQFALRRRLDIVMRGLGTTTAQYAALEALDTSAWLSGADLARQCFVTPQTMTGIISQLERSQLVTRRPHATHGRVIQAGLTDSGRELLMTCRTAAKDIEDAMLQRLTTNDRKALTKLLDGCLDGLESARVDAGPR